MLKKKKKKKNYCYHWQSLSNRDCTSKPRHKSHNASSTTSCHPLDSHLMLPHFLLTPNLSLSTKHVSILLPAFISLTHFSRLLTARIVKYKAVPFLFYSAGLPLPFTHAYVHTYTHSWIITHHTIYFFCGVVIINKNRLQDITGRSIRHLGGKGLGFLSFVSFIHNFVFYWFPSCFIFITYHKKKVFFSFTCNTLLWLH